MGNNRFLEMNTYLKDDRLSRFGVRARKPLSRAKTKKKDCPQFGEEAIDSNQFVLDVLQFFFEERLKEEQLNDEFRDLAARAAWAATEGSKAMDLVPRPPMGKPGVLWLVSQAVQIAFRKAQNRCIYEAVRVTVKLSLRSEYEIIKNTSVGQSFYTRAFEKKGMRVSENGLSLIKQFEGLRKNLYNDPVGHCTIGYGTLVHTGNCNGNEPDEYKAGITEERATELLAEKVSSFGEVINNNVQVALNQNQFDALVSFVYNIGSGAFGQSTLLKELNKGNYANVPGELKKWVKASGQTLPGLVNRRNAEAELFQRPMPAEQQSFRDWSWTKFKKSTAVKTITAVEAVPVSGDNGFLDAKAAKNSGCLRVSSVADMVTKVLGSLAEGEKIQRLNLYGHGQAGVIGIGDGQGWETGKHINSDTNWQAQLNKLKGKFADNGEIFLGGCNTGADQKGADKLKQVADETGVKVMAPTGKIYGNCTEESGSVHQVAFPGQPAPSPISSPSDKKKKGMSTSHSFSIRDWINNISTVYVQPSANPVSSAFDSKYKFTDDQSLRQIIDGIDFSQSIDASQVSGKINASVFFIKDGQPEEYVVFSDYDYILKKGDWKHAFEVKWSLKQFLKSLGEDSNNLFV
ncbi:MAG TPA: glycoside hydrolase family protein [Flavisolibacter sp.]